MEAREGTKDLVVLEGVKKHYVLTRGFLGKEVGVVRAVDGVDLAIRRGETLGLVGESGSGKSTLGRLILRLEDPTDGSIRFDGRDLARIGPSELLPMRRRMQVIFQDPYASLNPRQTVGRIIGEGLVIHGIGTPEERRDRVFDLMERVGLRPEHFSRYPHEFSGGQRQRIGVARALALNPELIVCDEPLSALDVSIQAQVINLLEDLQEEFQLTYLFISHDLSVVRHISDRVAVMYLGTLIEMTETEELFRNPLHPYTRTLLDAVPLPDPERAKRNRGGRDEPAEEAPDFAGCRFAPRCPENDERCFREVPPFIEVEPGHHVRCHRLDHPSDA